MDSTIKPITDACMRGLADAFAAAQRNPETAFGAAVARVGKDRAVSIAIETMRASLKRELFGLLDEAREAGSEAAAIALDTPARRALLVAAPVSDAIAAVVAAQGDPARA